MKILTFMPEDGELIRELLLRFERGDQSIPPGYTEPQIAFLVHQFHQWRLVKAHIIWGPALGVYEPKSFKLEALTPRGHDFIANIKNDAFWEKLKAEIALRRLPLTLPTMLATELRLTEKKT